MKRLFSGIGSKIVLPYLLLTLTVAGIGAFVVVNLVTGTLHERFNNQLLDSGRVVAESMVRYEEDRLAVLRQVSNTEGVPESVANQNESQLNLLVPQIMANSPTDVLILLDKNGRSLFAWDRLSGSQTAVAYKDIDFAQVEDVELVLSDFADEFGDKRALLAETPSGTVLFTLGPVLLNDEVVGAVMVGTAVRSMVYVLTENAVARVTLYRHNGEVIGTTLGNGRDNMTELLNESPEQYATVINLLAESPNRYQVVAEQADTQVPLRRVEVLNQEYQLAFGDWRLRNESFGLFSVALPSNFIVSAAATSRNLLNVVFTLATIAVFMIGFWVARSIATPLNRLVDVTTDVTEGNLSQRTGILRNDEIGALALSFDTMTERLDERNRQLVAQKSELIAILNSIADGVIVLDNEHNMVKSNPAAARMIEDLMSDSSAVLLQKLLSATNMAVDSDENTRRVDLNGRVLSVSSAPLKTPEGSPIGTVMVLRDITRTAEAESLKDDFITNMSHELRTPLTVVKVYTDMLKRSANGSLNEQQYVFLEKIAKSGGELEEHIQKMISISEMQAGTLSLKKEEFSFTTFICNLVEEWREQIEAKGIFFLLQTPKDELPVLADAGRLHWAISNLIENALDYTTEKGSIQLTVHKEGKQVYLEISDSGIGIPHSDQPYIFERFFRAKNDVNFAKRGIGLGLFIAREIFELHGGRIRLESKVGVGSSFHCELPLLVETAVIEELVAQ
ncbi:MAG: HAMP domain-containing protein [Ardenticatenaceae bacterium]|nr:HAMP domain-containing protein [Ardenticatenaceae bacterium]